jgi:hypothetical protein
MEVKEEWRDIAGYEGLYQVSNLGRVKSLARKNRLQDKILTPCNLTSGYLFVALRKNGNTKQFTVHRLVSCAFIPNPENKPCVDHIDCNRHNNCAANLSWVTYSENNLNPITRKRNTAAQSGENGFWYGKFGKQHNRSKPVICVETGKFFGGIAEAKRETGIQTICAALKNKQSTAGGYHWRYATPEKIKEVM